MGCHCMWVLRIIFCVCACVCLYARVKSRSLHLLAVNSCLCMCDNYPICVWVFDAAWCLPCRQTRIYVYPRHTQTWQRSALARLSPSLFLPSFPSPTYTLLLNTLHPPPCCPQFPFRSLLVHVSPPVGFHRPLPRRRPLFDPSPLESGGLQEKFLPADTTCVPNLCPA